MQLWFLVRDPLAQVVPPLDPDPDPGRLLVDGIPVAVAEDGTVWRLKIVGSHVLLVGRTGAGKSAVLWAIILGLAPLVRSGLVKLWVIDPKGGMELAAGRPLFDRFAYGDADHQPRLRDRARRAARGRRRGDAPPRRPAPRPHPTPHPHHGRAADRAGHRRAGRADRLDHRPHHAQADRLRPVAAAQSQGRAVGVVVVGALQDPRKDVIPQRDLFPIRVGLAVCEAEHVRLSLGTDAHNRGAHCELIPETMPGVAYVAVDGIPDPVRVRFAWHSDDHIAQLIGPPAAVVPLESGRDGRGLIMLDALWSVPIQGQVAERLARPDFGRWLAQVQQVRRCSHPVRLAGTSHTVDSTTGEILGSYDTAAEPDGVAYVRCGNRRASVCPSCSHEYKGDVWHVLMAGAAGGMKDVPDTVAAHPLVFATFTAPSFGPVHTAKKPGRPGSRRCTPRTGDRRQLCPHGRPLWCMTIHDHGDGLTGQPLCAGLLRLPGPSGLAVVGARNCGGGSPSPYAGSWPATSACPRPRPGSWSGCSSPRSPSTNGAASSTSTPSSASTADPTDLDPYPAAGRRRSTRRRWPTSSARPPARSPTPLPPIDSNDQPRRLRFGAQLDARPVTGRADRETHGAAAAPGDGRGLHRQVRHQSRGRPPHRPGRRQRPPAAAAGHPAAAGRPRLVRLPGRR